MLAALVCFATCDAALQQLNCIIQAAMSDLAFITKKNKRHAGAYHAMYRNSFFLWLTADEGVVDAVLDC